MANKNQKKGDEKMKKMDIFDLEMTIKELLPKEIGAEVNVSEIEQATREFIAASEYTDVETYIHSVCHLFEGYHFGYRGQHSTYLNSDKLLPIAEELVNVALKKAMESNFEKNLFRIINPIVDYNVAHVDTIITDFAFRPSILNDSSFIEFIRRFKEYNLHTSSEFCESKSMMDFFTKSQWTNYFAEEYLTDKHMAYFRREHGGIIDDCILSGIYIDVDNTLLKFGEKGRVNSPTSEYAIRKMEEGKKVVVFTGANPALAAARLKNVGADPRLCRVEYKANYIGKTLEICIDDTEPNIQGFSAKTYYQSGEEAMDAEYQK